MFASWVFDRLVCCLVQWAAFIHRPGRFYSGDAVSPPGLGDIRGASSLTNKPCVGLKEKPPRRCQNKTPRPDETPRFGAKHTTGELLAVKTDGVNDIEPVCDEKWKLILRLLIIHKALSLFWRRTPDMEVLSAFYLKLHLLFTALFSTPSSGNVWMFQTLSQLLDCWKVSTRSQLQLLKLI